MSKSIGKQLPPEIRTVLDGTVSDDRIGLGYLVTTVDPDGRPRPAMLSPGEMLVRGPAKLRIGLWPGSRTGRNLTNGSQFCLCFAGPGVSYYVHGRGTRLYSPGDLDCFDISVTEVESDVHEGLPVEQTITYTCAGIGRGELLEAWADQLDQLRSAGSPAEEPGA